MSLIQLPSSSNSTKIQEGTTKRLAMMLLKTLLRLLVYAHSGTVIFL